MATRLLYFTTSGSNQHLRALECWWNAPWVREYDVHLYSNRELSLPWQDTLYRIPAKNHTISIDKNQYMHQKGAIRAFVFSRPLFEKYEWVIRTNPDVHVLNHRSFSGWMMNPQVHAILANCSPDVECFTSCARAIVHTDFTIFRPQFLEWNDVSASNAEMHMSLVMRQILSRHNVRWLQGKGYRDRSCRIRAGVREHNQTVIHRPFHIGCHGVKNN